MAQRRMFSQKIINSARFLKMPVDSQNLYFHLGMNADDDGIVEAYTVLKSTGSNEDNLKVLTSKGFVKVLNEDLVSYITDWKEHNLIRADRKVDSIYKNLLLQIVPEADLIEPMPRADTGKCSGRQVDVKWTSQDRIGKDRIGKDRIGKDRIGKDNKDYVSTLHKEIIEYLNLKAKKGYRLNNNKTISFINARLNEGFKVEDFKTVIDIKCLQWLNKKDMAIYLRPETLFGTKFESYLNEKPKNIEKPMFEQERFTPEERKQNAELQKTFNDRLATILDKGKKP